MEAAPPLQATDGLSHAYEYEVGARRKVAAALARATRPFAVLGAVVARDLDLVEMCLHAAAVDAPGQPPAFSFWVAHAHATLRALVLGCPERQTNRTVIVHSDDTSIELRMRWTEDAVHAPLPASRWAAALGIACLAEDEELLAALVEPGWQERLGRHEQEVSVPAHHRLLLAAALASLVRGDAMPDLAQVRDALERDIAGPRPGPEGLIRDPSALRRDVEPLLAAIEMFATRDADEAATRAAWDAYVASVRAAPPTVLYALARVAARRGIAGALPSWAPCFAVADRRAPPTVEELEPLPPTSARDARDLARCAEALSTATTDDEWATVQHALQCDVATLRHLFAHGAWWPRAPIQTRALIFALAADRVDPGLIVRGLAAAHEQDLAGSAVYAFVLVARALRQARSLLLATALAPPLARLVDLARALAGDELDATAATRLPQAISELFETAFGWPIVEADDAGTTAPVPRERVEATLARVCGPRWRDALAPHARTRFPAPATLEFASELAVFVKLARNGSPAVEQRIPALGARGAALLPRLALTYDRLREELRATPSAEAARAALALSRAAASALQQGNKLIEAQDERYYLRDPLVWAALPNDEKSAARAHALDAIRAARLCVKGRCLESWAEAEIAEVVAPAPPPTPSTDPPRRRRIVT